jgi:hypothetical protein
MFFRDYGRAMSENAKLEDDLVVDVAQRRAAVIAMIQYIRDEAATLSADAAHLLDLTHEALVRADEKFHKKHH